MKKAVMFLLTAVVSSALYGQNLLLNPSFNNQTVSWYVGGAAGSFDKSAWDGSKDATASNLSGAMKVVNSFPMSNASTSYVRQCVAVTPGTRLQFGGRYFVPSAQNGTGRTGAEVAFLSGSLCQGTQINRPGVTISSPVQNAWTDVFEADVVVPAGAVSAEVRFQADKLSGSEYVVYWDDTFLTVEGGCRANNRWLCVTGNRFELELSATDPRTGGTAEGVVAEQQGVFGYFSLPALTGDAGNPEVFVKVLDGRGVNGRFWVFYSGLTDLEFRLKVRDLAASDSREYVKPGLVLQSVADTAAF